ncbi:MAG: ABC transporter permease subunit [Hyphomicrobiaceae bacterium]|nr:ABC transporter permease subunit [Hyphomicrobiaceae bacterium]
MPRILKFSLWAGFAFLYAPILVLIAYSFNASRRGSVWGGFSTHWYGELFRDEQILNAAWISIKVAVYSATGATLLGLLAAVAMVRFGKFRGRTLFSGLMSAPLVMPEVIVGISLLLLFISAEQLIGWPAGRGILTITIAHITFCTAFVLVVLQPRMATMDRSLEEASRDLGAGPVTTFVLVTLPVIAPAIVSGWLLAFILSFDDLVIASFTAGPGSTTLPMLIFSKVKIAVSPDINALATLIILVAALGLVAAMLLTRNRNNQQ